MDRRIKVIVPIPMDAAGVANRARQLPAGMARSGFNPEFDADPKSSAICSQFSVLITPVGSDTPLRYENCNRFYMKDRLFHRVFVYMADENLLKEGAA